MLIRTFPFCCVCCAQRHICRVTHAESAEGTELGHSERSVGLAFADLSSGPNPNAHIHLNLKIKSRQQLAPPLSLHMNVEKLIFSVGIK